MLFPVFFDTCTLYGALITDLVLRFAECRLYTPYWSPDVLKELERVLTAHIGKEKAQRRVCLMEQAFPDAAICGYEELIPTMQCSKEDRHVLAAACYSPAETLVTFNVKDFPRDTVEQYGIEVKHPDDFLLDVFDLNPGLISQICLTALRSYRLYPVTPNELCEVLAKSSVPQFATKIYPSLDALYRAM